MSYLLAEMGWPDVAAYLESDDRIILPIGSTEQHGRHLPLSTDILVPTELARHLGERTGVLVAPPLPYGMSLHHLGFPGSLSLRPETLAHVLEDLLRSLYCHGFRRVFVLNGHLECTSVALRKKPSVEEFTRALAEFRGRPQELELPSAPERPIIVRTEEDRPQPRFDRDHGNGMSITVGRIRPCNVLDFKFLILSHNTVRGAAGASILNAEYLKAEGYF